MERDRILALLRKHEQELKAAGLLHLHLFGSIARGEEGAQSDVDLLFEYDESETRNLLRAYGFQEELSNILGAPTHLSCAKYMRPAIRERALQEAVLAY